MERILWALCLLAVLVPLFIAGQGAEAQEPSNQTVKVDVDLVNILFTVCNKRGRFITDLGRNSFTVFEDDSPQVITNFSHETDLPLRIALLIDTSGSVREKIRFEQAAATEFFRSILRRGLDKTLVYSFDSSVSLLQDYTDDPDLLAKAVGRIRAGGGTSLYSAVHLAVTERLSGQEGRRVIILLSDGVDNSSMRNPEGVLESVQRNDVTIYAISTNGIGFRMRQSDFGDSVLSWLAEETGGKAFFPRKLEHVTAGFEKIGKELRAQYSLAYRSTNPSRDGAFRKIRIDVTNSRLSVRSRSGYYAPVETAAHQ